MLNVLKAIPTYVLGRRMGWPKSLPISMTITPSPRCNSRCLTCNIWQKHTDELTLDEWDRIFVSLGHAPHWFTISGGEPFLYRDLVPLCQSLYQHCKPGVINIPTNSLLYRTIPGKVETICESCPDAQVIINLSLDGIGEKHDAIRGVPGNFQKFEANYAALRQLDCPNLTIGVHSVISRYNVGNTAELYDYALALGADSYITEIAEQRAELGTLGLDIQPAAEAYQKAIDDLASRLNRQTFRGISRLTEAFRVRYYELVKRILTEKTQVIPCYAGWASAQIYANGDVWACCVRADSMGNLRDADYDFRRVWTSASADRIRTSIRNKECHCPLANASYTNMLMDIPTLVRVGTQLAHSFLTVGER